jgi:hypothetical protein
MELRFLGELHFLDESSFVAMRTPKDSLAYWP